MNDRAACGIRRLCSGVLASACCLAAFAGAAGPVLAQSDAGLARTPTVTRLVTAFSDLESRLDTAARTHDAEALVRLLAPDFEVRSAVRPGVPVTRAQFVEQMAANASPAALIEQMAVHDLGVAAIVSFEMRYGADAAPLFVVDVWGRAGNEWQLQVRYAGLGGIRAAHPGAPAPDAANTLPKKY